MVAENHLVSAEVPFQAEGRLLQELGERLVASPDVALVELVKNAYDADSPSCSIRIDEDANELLIQDSGSGMTLEEFLSRWMRIATSHKISERHSPKYCRPMTGQKGIGRFAVRFLGRKLRLESVAIDRARRCRTRLVADFDWQKIDKAKDMGTVKIPYQLTKAPIGEPTGTTLRIGQLKVDKTVVTDSRFRTSVLRIVSPTEGLERGRFARTTTRAQRTEDPGFVVTLPGIHGPDEDETNLADEILQHSWARLTIDLKDNELTYHVGFANLASERTLRKRSNSNISRGLLADIRFFPRRAGLFKGTGVDGRKAWTWVRENHGVAIVDHGFRVKPYGYEDDDWLFLDRDNAHNRRDWRSSIASKYFPIPKEIAARPGENPMLNLPSNFQLVGAVFVESAPASRDASPDDLTPSMDREGFLDNEAFRSLVDVVRGGLEFLAQEDKKKTQEEDEERAEEALRETREDLRAAIAYIRSSPALTAPDKHRLIEQYSHLAKRLEEVEDYDREARRRLETMSLLGVVSGFLTHEATRIIASMEDAIAEMRKVAKFRPSVVSSLRVVEKSYDAFQAHLDYTRIFTDAVQQDVSGPFKAAAQVRNVIDKFGLFAEKRHIVVECEIPKEIEVPPMPVTVYSGVLLNLYTNALKAIVAMQSANTDARIVFRAWNDPKWHSVEVLDTGVGIPPNLRKRVWDPLFTTTSRLNNPLGSGMGLGLSLVKELVERMGGRIEIVDPPAGFNTCFRVSYPRRAKG